MYSKEPLLPPLLEQSVGFNGYFTLALDGDVATVSYKTVACADAEGKAVAARAGAGTCAHGLSATTASTLATETFTVGADGSVAQKTLSISNAMTKP